MNKKFLIAIVCVFVLGVTMGLGLYMHTVQAAEEVKDAITLIMGDKSIVVPLTELDQVEFEGETVNGKGDRSTHAYRGVELQALLAAHELVVKEEAVVIASSADQYTAELTEMEVSEEGRVYVVVEMDGKKVPGIDEGTDGAQLVVFGDPNSRRNVRFLAVIEIKEN